MPAEEGRAARVVVPRNHMHYVEKEFYHQANNELFQYGTNKTDLSDFFNSTVNWDNHSDSIYLEASASITRLSRGAIMQNRDVGLFQNNSQIIFSTDFSMGYIPILSNRILILV
ncbi:hypothetical protein RYX36_024467 [Vicia faba]